VHSGEALFHRVLNFQELAGVDVIIVHRLLKNSVKADQYLLMTDTAQKDVQLPDQAKVFTGRETYEDLGELQVAIYFPEGTIKDATRAAASNGFGNRFSRAWLLLVKMWFKPLAGSAPDKERKFRHLESDATFVGRWCFAALTMLLTPIYLPVGTIRA